MCVGCGSEGQALCTMCSTSEILPFGEKCWSCNRLSLRSQTCASCRASGAPNFVWINTDYEKIAKCLVSEYKFRHNRAAAQPISELMSETLLYFNQDEQLISKNYLIVPVPTASSRIRQRSFDHADLLAKNIAHKLKYEYRRALLRKGQLRQTGSKRAQRLKQISGSFYVKPYASIKSRNILLIDDVVTTGATISEAASTLRRAGARSVDALVFAKRL